MSVSTDAGILMHGLKSHLDVSAVLGLMGFLTPELQRVLGH